MKRFTLLSLLTASACLGASVCTYAAPPAASAGAANAVKAETPAAGVAAQKCLADLRAFNATMAKDGYWLGGSRYGYGHGVNTAGYGWYGYPEEEYPAMASAGIRDVRPGYEIRSLLVSANILARRGQQQACEMLLTTSRGIYQTYVSSLHGTEAPLSRMDGWQQRAIDSAQPVNSQNLSFNSDQLVGTEVLNPQGESLGNVHDIVTSPQSGKIAYLVIGRGGLFGIDEKYVPVPWADFKVAPNVSILVLTTTPSVMKAAPEVSSYELDNSANFDKVGPKVDAYWKTSLPKASND